MKTLYLLLAFAVLTVGACKKEDQATIDRDIILSYLEANNLTAEEDPSGLFYIIDVPGGQQKPTLANSVTVKYKGYLTNGTVFDETTNGNTATFPLSNLIAGWQIGIPKFGRGGKGVLIVPSSLGYGSRRVGSIPANSVLVFDMELVNF
ncbi:MAG: FKBP-type peptidyl-prolyl cis-trans isomerase [Saprospiraceae bacterium]